MDTQSSGKCHAQPHQILEGFNLQTGSVCNCPSLIPILVILGTPESQAYHQAYTRLLFTGCLHGTAKFPWNQKQSGIWFQNAIPCGNLNRLRSPQEVNALESSLPSHDQGCWHSIKS